MRKKMKVGLGAALVLVLMAAGAAVIWFNRTVVSTHHAQIWIRTQQYETEKGRMVGDYDRVVQVVEAWAGPAGFYRLPADTNLPRMRWFGSSQGHEHVVWFQEKTPRDKSFPREVMVACDPDGPFDIQLLLAEGYSRHPSQQLQAMYEALRQRVEGLSLGQVHGSVW